MNMRAASENVKRQAEKEVQILSQLNHANIVKYRESFEGMSVFTMFPCFDFRSCRFMGTVMVRIWYAFGSFNFRSCVASISYLAQCMGMSGM